MASDEGLVADGLFTHDLEGVGNWQGPQEAGSMSGALTGKPTLDFDMHQGCFRRITVTIAGDDGAPFDLTGCQVSWAVTSAGVEKSTQMGTVQVLDQGTQKGKCQFEIVADDTDTVPPGRHFHQLIVEDQDENEDVVLEGFLTLKINLALMI